MRVAPRYPHGAHKPLATAWFQGRTLRFQCGRQAFSVEPASSGECLRCLVRPRERGAPRVKPNCLVRVSLPWAPEHHGSMPELHLWHGFSRPDANGPEWPTATGCLDEASQPPAFVGVARRMLQDAVPPNWRWNNGNQDHDVGEPDVERRPSRTDHPQSSGRLRARRLEAPASSLAKSVTGSPSRVAVLHSCKSAGDAAAWRRSAVASRTAPTQARTGWSRMTTMACAQPLQGRRARAEPLFEAQHPTRVGAQPSACLNGPMRW